MGRYAVRRLIQLIPILIGITFLSFAMMRLAGSDAVTEMYANKGAVSQEVIDSKRAELGLDKPFVTQYFAWLGGMLRGDMGVSYVSGRDVFQTFVSKLPATLLLTALSILLTEQLECADVICVNKCDLADDDQIGEVDATVREMNAHAPIVHASAISPMSAADLDAIAGV